MPWDTESIKRLIELESHQRGIDPRLGLALAEQESGFDPQCPFAQGRNWHFPTDARDSPTAQS